MYILLNLFACIIIIRNTAFFNYQLSKWKQCLNEAVVLWYGSTCLWCRFGHWYWFEITCAAVLPLFLSSPFPSQLSLTPPPPPPKPPPKTHTHTHTNTQNQPPHVHLMVFLVFFNCGLLSTKKQDTWHDVQHFVHYYYHSVNHWGQQMYKFRLISCPVKFTHQNWFCSLDWFWESANFVCCCLFCTGPFFVLLTEPSYHDINICSSQEFTVPVSFVHRSGVLQPQSRNVCYSQDRYRYSPSVHLFFTKMYSQCLVCSWECYGPRPRIVVQKSVTVSAYILSSHECTADECSVYKSVIVIVPAYISSSHECTALICSVHKSVTVIVPVYMSSSHECTALVCSVHKSVMDPVPELLFTRVLQSQCTFFLHMNAQVLSVLFTRMLWTPSQNGCCSQECHSYSIYLLLMKVLLTQSQNVCCWQVLQSQYVCCSQECVWVSQDICCLRKFYSASIFLLTGALLSQYILLFTRMLQSHVAVPVYLSFTRVKKSEYILHKCYIPVCLLFSSQKRYSLVYLSFTRVLESQYILHKCSPVCLLFSSQKHYSLMYLSFTRVLAVFVVHMTAC